MADVFISYSRRDSEFAKRLHSKLAQQSKDVWIDFEDIPKGKDFLYEIYEGIEKADIFCFIMSRHSLISEICNLELEHAIKNSKRVLPVVIEVMNNPILAEVNQIWDEVTWKERAKHNWEITSHLNWLLFHDPENFDEEFLALMQAAEQDLDYVKAHTRYLVKALEWESTHHDPNLRDSSFLLLGSEITRCQDWLKTWDKLAEDKRPNPAPNELQRKYVEASYKAEENRRKTIRNLRMAGLGATVLGLAMLGLAIFSGLVSFNISNDAATANAIVGTSRVEATTANQTLVAAQINANVLETQSANEINAANTQVSSLNATLMPLSISLTSSSEELLTSQQEILESQQEIEIFRLASLAQEEFRTIDMDLQPSALLAIRSLQEGYSSQADGILISVLDELISVKAFTGHTEAVRNIAIHPNGNLLASVADDRTLILWDIDTGTIIHRLEGHTGRILSVAFSADGRQVASGSGDKTIKLWDTNTGELLKTFEGHTSSVTSIVFSPDNNFIASGSNDRTIRIWTIDDGSMLYKVDIEYALSSLAFHPNGTLLYGATYAGKIYRLNLANGTRRIILDGSENIATIAFSPDGSQYLLGTASGSMQLYDSANHSNLYSATFSALGIESMTYSIDGKWVAIGGTDGSIIVWDIFNQEEYTRFQAHNRSVTDVTFSPDSRYIFSSSTNGAIMMWTFNSRPRVFAGHTYAIKEAVIIETSNGYYGISTAHDATMRIWDISSQVEIETIEISGGTTDLIINPTNRNEIILADILGRVIFWNLDSPSDFTNILRGYTARDIAISPIGQNLVISSGEILSLVNIENNELLSQRSGFTNDHRITDVAINPRGNVIATGYSGGSIELRLGRASFGNTMPLILNSTNGRVVKILFDLDGSHLLSSYGNGQILLWNIAELSYQTFSGHEGSVNSIALSPDGTMFASASADGTVRLWNIETGETVRIFSGHEQSVNSVYFSPDGRYLLSGSSDTTLRLWDVNYQDTIAYACSRLTRDFTPEERIRYRVDANPTCPQFDILNAN